MTTNSIDSLEDRIQKPGYLLFLVIVFLLLIVGLVDLIDYMTKNPTILGRYNPRYFVILVSYALFTLAWATLLLRPNNDRLLTGLLDFLQMRPVLAIGALFLLGFVIVGMVDTGNTIDHPLLTAPAFQVTVFVVSLLFAGLILFYKWGDESRPQRWRKIVLAILGIIVAIELLLQALAFFGVLPSVSTPRSTGGYSPYNRIYQSEEGFGNGLANNYGRYAPDFQLLPDSYRIAVLGDSFVEGLQVEKEENFGVLLEQQFATEYAQDQVSEVFPLGHPDLGPGMYLSNWLLFEMIRELDPDEAVIFFDMGSDFQTVDRAGTGYPYFVYAGQGFAQIDSRKFLPDLHDAEHYVYRGYRGLEPVLVVQSNLLLPRLLSKTINDLQKDGGTPAGEESTATHYDINLPNGFVFNEKTHKNAARIASSQVNMAKEQLGRAGVGIKLVTNPVFTEDFYDQAAWNTVFGDSDLLLPERELRETAAKYGTPFLGLGAYMAAQEFTPAEVQELYFDGGLGHFTPRGHEVAAEAIYQCFYAQTLTAEDGCDIP